MRKSPQVVFTGAIPRNMRLRAASDYKLPYTSVYRVVCTPANSEYDGPTLVFERRVVDALGAVGWVEDTTMARPLLELATAKLWNQNKAER